MNYLLTLFIIFSCAAISCKNGNAGYESFYTSFEGEDPFAGWQNDQHCCEYSVQQSTEQKTDGNSSLRLEVRQTDPLTSRAIRAELVKEPEPMDVERNYSFNMFLQDWKHDNAGESVFQWHPGNFTGTATASLWTSGGRYVFQTNTGAQNYYIDLGPIISDRWVNWKITLKWSTDTSGYIKLWKNGDLMIDRKKIITAPPEGCYFKIGINKFGWGIQPSSVDRRVLYFDDVRIE